MVCCILIGICDGASSLKKIGKPQISQMALIFESF